MAPDDLEGRFTWHVHHDLLNKSPHETLAGIYEDDEKNKATALQRLPTYLADIDLGLEVFVAALQAFHQDEKWIDESPRHQAAVAMADDAFNFLLAGRQTLLHGYYVEGRTLLRAVRERMMRFAVFYGDENLSEKFFKGKEIGQVAVDKAFARIYAKPGEIHGVLLAARNAYHKLSEEVHPNLESLIMRVPSLSSEPDVLRQYVGKSPLLGGILGDYIGQRMVQMYMSELLVALHMLQTAVSSGGWLDAVRDITNKYNDMLTKLARSIQQTEAESD